MDFMNVTHTAKYWICKKCGQEYMVNPYGCRVCGADEDQLEEVESP